MESDQHGGDSQRAWAPTDSALLRSETDPGPINSPPRGTNIKKEATDHDSLVTVRLSEPSSLQVNTTVPPSTILPRKSPLPTYAVSNATSEPETLVKEEGDGPERNDGDDGGDDNNDDDDDDDDDSESEIFEPETSASNRRPNLLQELGRSSGESASDGAKRPKYRSSSSSTGSERVDWDELQKKEELELKGQEPGHTTTASTIVKPGQGIGRTGTDLKSTGTKATTTAMAATRGRYPRESKPRPPSMAQLRKMVTGPSPSALRYSTLPPTPMTELEFYLALVKDPKQTAARLPTLLSNKVRKGVPPPLRGVVWQSMAGARDSHLEDVFERLTGESSPYEGVISKDLGRSFPGVDMFRDPDGDGQRMLGRVLKCFSLYDTEIGYCQGLALLVGPLLMHMPDKQAFCVLVRLMENYDQRQCFVPDLAGLHIRIYQFRELLRQHLPTLSAHLDDLQVEPAYVSQWFLSFYAVTCPLPMLFRIYDVIFAEGASETIMRVALSLMRKNQVRILGYTELDDVMHLLLSRGVWDCYNYNADEFVQDFVALANVVTKERMIALEQGYKEAKITPSANHRGAETAHASADADVTTAASRFLGRLWVASSAPKLTTCLPPTAPAGAAATTTTTTTTAAPTRAATPTPTPISSSTSASSSTSTSSTSTSTTATPTPNNNLNPGLGAASGPLSMLRRSPSKQSLSSMEAASSTTSSAASVLSSVSTEATNVSRDSSADDFSREATPLPSFKIPSPAASFSTSINTSRDGSKHLHSQIEDLLTALSELQRNHTLLANQLQREKEGREEDRRAVRSLLDGLRNKAEGSDDSSVVDSSSTTKTTSPKPTAEQLSDLLDAVEERFSDSVTSSRSSASETKQQLRDELARTKSQLSQERDKTKGYNRKVQEMEQELSTVREQLRDTHAHVRNVHQEKQRIERQMQGMRLRASDTPATADKSEWLSKTASSSGGAAAGVGLRELKLGRSRSTPSQAASIYSNNSSNRVSSMLTMKKKESHESLASTAVLGPTDASSGTSGLDTSSASLTTPLNETDALLLELVQAKTAEAVARQELEEAKQKLEQLRKAFGLAPGETPPVGMSHHHHHHNHNAGNAAQSAAATAMGMFGRLTGSTVTSPVMSESPSKVSSPPPPAAGGAGGGFWGWRR